MARRRYSGGIPKPARRRMRPSRGGGRARGRKMQAGGPGMRRQVSNRFGPRKVPFAGPLDCSCECSEQGQDEGFCSFCIGANNHETPERMCSLGQGAVWCNWECGGGMRKGGRVNTNSRFSGRTQNNPKGKTKK